MPNRERKADKVSVSTEYACSCVCRSGGRGVHQLAQCVKVSLCCQGLSLLAARPACRACVCMCKADGKVDLKWTRSGNTRRVFLLAERRMESSLVDFVHFIFMIPCAAL